MARRKHKLPTRTQGSRGRFSAAFQLSWAAASLALVTSAANASGPDAEAPMDGLDLKAEDREDSNGNACDSESVIEIVQPTDGLRIYDTNRPTYAVNPDK
jgi:hypothetical protein